MPKSAVKERPKKNETKQNESTCQHHWYIATPAGSTSKGICRRCGEEREFRNSTTDYVGDGVSGGSGTPWRGSRPTKTTSDDPDTIDTGGASSKAAVVA